MTPIKIKPDPACKFCNGEGTVYDSVDYGSTTASMPSTCDCVLCQLPEGQEDQEVEIDLSDSDPTQEKREADAFEEWNAGERPDFWIEGDN